MPYNYINTELGYPIVLQSVKDVEITKNSICIYDTNLHDYAININSTYHLSIECTETSKDIQTVLNICQFLKEHHVSRDFLIYAIGGGIALDIINFSASIYKRGLDVVDRKSVV